MLTNLGRDENPEARRRWMRRFAALVLSGLCLQALGCAHVPPGDNTPSGKRLHVIMTFRNPIGLNSTNLYYFCINLAPAGSGFTGDPNAPGPIPVGSPISNQTYGNGFATSSVQGQAGFTDFVLFSPIQSYNGSTPQDGFAIYHVLPAHEGGADNRQNFFYTEVPRVRLPPNSASPYSIEFKIDLTQLVINRDLTPMDPVQALNYANMIRYLQVNIIATNIAPAASQTSVDKMFDSMGDNKRHQNAFLTLNTQNSHWDSGQVGSTAEPSDPDVVSTSDGATDPSLDLVSWSIDLETN